MAIVLTADEQTTSRDRAGKRAQWPSGWCVIAGGGGGYDPQPQSGSLDRRRRRIRALECHIDGDDAPEATRLVPAATAATLRDAPSGGSIVLIGDRFSRGSAWCAATREDPEGTQLAALGSVA